MHRTRRRSLGELIVDKGPHALCVWASIVVCLGIYRGQSSISLYLSLKDSEVVLSKAVSDLQKENDRLDNEIFKLRKSKDYARKVLRDRYHVTEANEKIIYFAD